MWKIPTSGESYISMHCKWIEINYCDQIRYLFSGNILKRYGALRSWHKQSIQFGLFMMGQVSSWLVLICQADWRLAKTQTDSKIRNQLPPYRGYEKYVTHSFSNYQPQKSLERFYTLENGFAPHSLSCLFLRHYLLSSGGKNSIVKMEDSGFSTQQNAQCVTLYHQTRSITQTHPNYRTLCAKSPPHTNSIPRCARTLTSIRVKDAQAPGRPLPWSSQE